MGPDCRSNRFGKNTSHLNKQVYLQQPVLRVVVASISLGIIIASCSGPMRTNQLSTLKIVAVVTPMMIIAEYLWSVTPEWLLGRFDVRGRIKSRPRQSEDSRPDRCCSTALDRKRFRHDDWLNKTCHSSPSPVCIGTLDQRRTKCNCRHCTEQRTIVDSDLPDSLTAQSKANAVMKRSESRLNAANNFCDEAGLFKLNNQPDYATAAQNNGLTTKSVIDRFVAICALSAIAPLLLVLYVLMKCLTRGATLTIVERLGWHGRLIPTMQFKTQIDCKLTENLSGLRLVFSTIGVADFLRRSGLSTLPSLVSVIRGELALVGPNPSTTTASAIENAGQIVVAQMAERQNVEPGLLDYAFSRSAFGSGSIACTTRERTELNIYYLSNMTPWLDARCAGRTLALLSQRPIVIERRVA